MAFDIVGARKAGYSDNEIADHLGKQANFDVPAARKAGYGTREIMAHLSSAWAHQELPADIAPSEAGAGRGVQGGPGGLELASAEPPPRRGGTRAEASPFVGGDAQAVTPAAAPAGQSPLDRPDAPGPGLSDLEMSQGSVAPWKLDQQRQQSMAAAQRTGVANRDTQAVKDTRPGVYEGTGLDNIAGKFSLSGAKGMFQAIELGANALRLLPEAGAGTGMRDKLGDVATWARMSGDLAQAAKDQDSRAQWAQMQQILQDPNANIATVMGFLMTNPGITAEMTVESAGVMVPAITAGKLSASLAERLSERVLSGQTISAGTRRRIDEIAGQAAGTGAAVANIGMGAGGAFDQAKQKGATDAEAYTAAGLTGLGYWIAHRATGGGAEAALAKGSGMSTLGTAAKEGAQESIESLSESVGAASTPQGQFDAGSAFKQAALEGSVGAVAGGAIGAMGAERSPTQQIAGVTNQNADLWEKFFRRDAIVSSAPAAPSAARAASITRFDELAAAFGLDPAAAAKVREQAGVLPTPEVPGFLARVTGALNKRGLFRRPVDDAGVQALDDTMNTVEAPPEAKASNPDAKPTGQGTPTLSQPNAQGAQDYTGLSEPSPAPTGVSVSGEPINRNWTAFAPESGTLSIPREQMPQIDAAHRGALVNFLNARGIEHQAEEVAADTLKPTQAEFSPKKVQGAADFQGGDRSILVSADGYILDGTHQWLAKREAGAPVKIIRLQAPIQDLLRLAHQFPSSTTSGGAARATNTEKPNEPVGNVDANAGALAVPLAGRGSEPGGSGGAVGPAAAEPGRVGGAAGTLALGGGAAGTVAGRGVSDGALTVGGGGAAQVAPLKARVDAKRKSKASDGDLSDLERKQPWAKNLLRIGGRAFDEGTPRTPPDGFTPNERRGWLAGWDDAAAGSKSKAAEAAAPTGQVIDIRGELELRAAAKAMAKAERDEVLFTLKEVRDYLGTGALSEEDARTVVAKLQEVADGGDFDTAMETIDPIMSNAAGKNGERLKPANDGAAPTPAAEGGKTAEDDYIAQLFGTPAEQAASQERLMASIEAKKRDVKRIQGAIQTEQKRAAAEHDDWAGRVYKGNKSQVELRGDGPSNRESMSIGAINESRRRNAMEALAQEMKALDKLAEAVSTESGAERVLSNMRDLMAKAERAVESGNWPNQTADEMFQSMLLEDLKFRGPGGKGNVTSNGLSKAVLAAIKPEATTQRDTLPDTPVSGVAPAEPPHYAEIRARTRAFWDQTGIPAIREYLRAYDAFGVDRLERNRIKPAGISAREWLESWVSRQSKWQDGRKVSDTGVQALSNKDLWPTTDGSGERLRKAMLAAVKALKNAPGSNGDLMDEAFMEPKATTKPRRATSDQLSDATDFIIELKGSAKPARTAAEAWQRYQNVMAVGVRSGEVLIPEADFVDAWEQFNPAPAAPAAAEPVKAKEGATTNLNKPRAVPKKQALTPGGSLKADATNSRADSAVWYYQGDMGRLRFTASVTIDGKPDLGAAQAKELLAQIKAAQDAGWKRANYRAGSLGTVWVYERGDEFLTRAGMENAGSDVTAWPDIPSYGAGYDNMVRGQREFAAALDRWLNTLPADQQQNQGVVSRKMADVLGGWAGIERDNSGLWVRYYPRQDDGRRAVRWLHTIPASQTWEEARAKIAKMAGPTRTDDAGNVAMFSRRSTIGRPRMTLQEVENEALALTAGWANAPRVVVVNSMHDSRVPKAVRDEFARQQAGNAEGVTDGFIYGNTVYLVASELRTTADVARVLFHESLGHYGLRGLYGAELDKILRQMAALMPDRVIAKAREYGLDPKLPADRLRAAEEVLAEIAQARPESTWVQRAIAAIRTWLRNHVPALAGLNLTDAELIRNYIVPARTFVERGRLDGMRAVPMFSRRFSSLKGARPTASYVDATPRQQATLDAIDEGPDSTDYDLLPAKEDLAQSADASFTDWEQERGIKYVSLDMLGPFSGYDNAKDTARIRRLADAIKASNTLEPIFVGIDPNGEAYIMEGQHRARALQLLGETHVPAQVIVSMEGDEADYAAPVDEVRSGPTDYKADERQIPMFSRAQESSPEEGALQSLSEFDALYALPKSDKSTVEEIAAENDPGVKVRSVVLPNRETMWTLTMADGSIARITQRPGNTYGQPIYGYEFNGASHDPVLERPGTNPEAVPDDTGDVWIDVSQLKEGGDGALIYNIASTFAHNTGQIFIGDPAGLSEIAMRRRLEHMLASALKFGTTRHLAPHPDQTRGSGKIGMPALDWTYFDDVGNVRRMIDASLRAIDNAFPTSKALEFDVNTGQFVNASTGRPVSQRGLARSAVDARAKGGVGSGARAGRRTIARAAVFRALLREQGAGVQGQDGQRPGLLARLAEFAPALSDVDPGNRVFMSRRKPSGNTVLDEARRKAGNVGTASLAEKIRNVWASGIQSLSSPGAFAREFRQGALDQFAGIQNAEQATLGNLPDEQSAYVTARLANGGTSSVMRAILLHGQPRWARNGQHLEAIPNTEGLLDILKPLGEDLNDWFDWMIGNRAERLMREGRENNFTPAEIAALQGVVAGNPAKLALFRSTSLKYAAFKKSILDVAQDAGLINAEGRRVWDNADYIPFYREIDRNETLTGISKPGISRVAMAAVGKKGLAGQSSGIRTLKGGDSALNDPMENLLMNFSRLIDASLKNNAIRKTIHEVGVPGGLATKVGYAMTSELVPTNQIKQVLVNAGTPQAILDVIPDAAFEGMAKMWAIQAPTDPAVVRVMVDGKPEFYRVDEPYLLRSLTSFVPFDFPGLGVMRAAKRVLTAAVTATPEFMIRNFIRDTVSTRMIARDGVSIGSTIRGMYKSYTEGGAYEAMLFSGASFQSGNINAGTPEGTATAMRRALRDRGMSAASVDAFMQTVLDTPAKVWEKYRHFGEAIENANREAVYEAAIKAGKTPTEAAYETKDLMDFTLRGSWAGYQFLADVLPFFNAHVQSLYRLGRADPKKVAMYGTALMVASVLLALANADDDRYNRLPDWDKDTYWHFFVGQHHWRIPKPFELGVVFATIPERITRYLVGVDTGTKTVGRVASSVVEQLAFDPLPQLFRPAFNVWANKDTFRDTPIENQRDEGLPAHMRYSATTSDTARLLLEATAKATDKVELSPKKLEYLVGGYLGTAGLAALGLSDMVVRKLEGKPPGPEWRADDYPVVRVFYRVDPAKATVFESDLYDLRQEVNKVFKSVGTLKDPLKANDPAKAQKVQRDNAELLSLRPTVENAANMLAGLNRKRDAIYADPNMTPAQKRAELDRIYQAKGDVAQKTMTAPAVKARQ